MLIIGSGATPETKIVPIAANWADSAADAVNLTVNGISILQPAVNSRLTLSIPAGCRTVLVRATSNVPNTIPIGCYLDGAYYQSLTLTVGTALVGFTISLDGAAHTMELWTPYQEFFTKAALVYDVTGAGISVVAPVAPTRILIDYGDSIVANAQASPGTQNGYVCLLRQQVPTLRVACEAQGGRKLYDDVDPAGTGFANVNLLAARLALLATGASQADVWLAIGVNDALGGPYNTTTFGVAYAALIAAVHAAMPSARIYCQSMLISTTHEGVLPAWRTVIQNAANGLAYCTYVDGTTLCSVGNLNDDIHPNNAGDAQICTAIRAVLGV